MVRRVRRGLRRIIGVAQRRQAHPLAVDELTRMVTAIDPGTVNGRRDRAMLLLGYASDFDDAFAPAGTVGRVAILIGRKFLTGPFRTKHF